VKTDPRKRSILHVDLDPFFVSVERSVEPALRGRPVVVGGHIGGIVAAASAEARAAGVKPGQPLMLARRMCPQAVFRTGDLDAYARISDDVTTVLLSVSRRVERPSADEAYVDLTPDSPTAPLPVAASELVKDELQRRLRLDASLGLASSRLAARVASRWARPRGLLVVLPGYEERFLAEQSVAVLPDLPPHLESALARAEIHTLGQLVAVDEAALTSVVGTTAARKLRETALCQGEDPIALAAPPTSISEQTLIRDRRSDRPALLDVAAGLAARAARRLRPFDLAAGVITVAVHRKTQAVRRSEELRPAVADEVTLQELARRLTEPLLEPAAGVASLEVRLGRLDRISAQVPLFPGWSGLPERRAL
jgi:DNA polymerase IV